MLSLIFFCFFVFLFYFLERGKGGRFIVWRVNVLFCFGDLGIWGLMQAVRMDGSGACMYWLGGGVSLSSLMRWGGSG